MVFIVAIAISALCVWGLTYFARKRGRQGIGEACCLAGIGLLLFLFLNSTSLSLHCAMILVAGGVFWLLDVKPQSFTDVAWTATLLAYVFALFSPLE